MLSFYQNCDRANQSRTIFYHVQTQEQTVDGKIIFNDGEVAQILLIIQQLTLLGVDTSDIAVLTPYRGQHERLKNTLTCASGFVSVYTVDSFQVNNEFCRNLMYFDNFLQ